MNEQIQAEQINTQQPTNWMDEELKEIEASKPQGDYPDALILEENKVTEFEIDFSKAFDKWVDPASHAIKKIIPVTHEGKAKVLWMNCANPTYKEIIDAGMKGQKVFKIMRTGQKKQTRYTLVKE